MTHRRRCGVAIVIAIGVVMMGGAGGRAWAQAGAASATGPLAVFDSLAARYQAFAANPHLRRENLAGAARNLMALATRWNAIGPQLAQLIASRAAIDFGPTWLAGDAVEGMAEIFLVGPRPISNVTLGATRFTGFTQNETAGAWCGVNVAVAFNDTGSEIRTLLGSGGVSAVGFSTSSNRGGAFGYQGPPAPPANSWQALIGDPSLACADANNFYFSSVWYDSLNNQTGISLAHSTDGGRTFPAPSPAILKSSLTDIIGQDKLALDHADPALLYLVYADTDFSGAICGTDGNSQPIPRYGIELVASTDGGVNWSAPPRVVDQVCADQNNPYAMDAWPQVTVGPSGEVYVAWESMGVNGDPTARAIEIVRSTDNAASFGAPVVAGSVVAIGDGADLQGFIRANEAPALAVGRGKKNAGVVYLAWSNASFTVQDALSTTGLYGLSDVMFAQSASGGASWSSAIRVNNNPEGGRYPFTDQFEPAINTDKTGRIGICFYDRRRDPNNFLIDRYCASSTNGGKSFANIKVTPVNFPAVVGQDAMVAPDYMGEYDTVAIDGTGAAAGFVDSYASNVFGNPNVLAHHF